MALTLFRNKEVKHFENHFADAESSGVIFKHLIFLGSCDYSFKEKKTGEAETLGVGGGGLRSCTGKTKGFYQRHTLRYRRPCTTAYPACWAMGTNE
jgi:hypothetical protein